MSESLTHRLARHLWALTDHDIRAEQAATSGSKMLPSREWSRLQKSRCMRLAAYSLQILTDVSPEEISQAYATAWEEAEAVGPYDGDRVSVRLDGDLVR